MNKNENLNELNNTYSSKIKKIYIQLEDYTFYHSPCEINNTDKRFIGRKKLLDRLKIIMASSETSTGAYLITGHRGMGKSSFVSKALSEISMSTTKGLKLGNFVRIIMLIIIFAFISKDNPFSKSTHILSFIFNWFSILYVGGGIIYQLLMTVKQNGSFCKSKPKILFVFLRKIFIINSSSRNLPKNRYKSFFQDIFISLFINNILIIIAYYKKNYFYIDSIYYGFIIFYILLITNFIVQIYQNLKERKDKKNNKLKDMGTTSLINNIMELFYYLRSEIKRYLNYSRKLYIKINFSYDDLKEIDILRLIARSVKNEYAHNFRPWRKLLISIVTVLLLYIFIGIIYYYTPIYNSTNEIKKELNVYMLFPSQLDSILLNPNDLLNNFAGVNIDKKSDLYYIKEINKKYNFTDKHALDSKVLMFTNIHKITLSIINQADIFIYNFYRIIRKILVKGILLGIPDNINLINDLSISDGTKHFMIIPYNLDYFFIIYLIIGYIIYRRLLRIRIFGIISHRNILKKLDELNDMIDASISYEKTDSIGSEIEKFRFNIFKSKKKSYNRIDEREIEKCMIEIFESINKIPKITIRPEFVFIFDELDKLISNSEFIKNEDTVIERNEGQYLFRRTDQIFKLLSNLKFFLTTARAKFIFIASRDIYDASLADISDRNYFLGSIFHEVIYVESFLSDYSENGNNDISGMTELYVCNFLISKRYLQKNKIDKASLKVFNQYLLDCYGETYDELFNKINNYDKIIARQKREKIIFTLFQFIIYLTHISNGAPKKITKFFESYITGPPSKNDKDKYLLVGNIDEDKLYLAFNFYQQHEFGMISYLTSPIINSISNTVKEYGDRLLVSSSFLTDHLLKFHKNAFSYRNIELAPELIDINKPPELRDFISNMISYLTNTHIRILNSGLFHFRYSKRISVELSFLSKISENSSAAYNFTLDEMKSVKQYFINCLKDIKKGNSISSNGKDPESFIHSIASIYFILGDLSFYEENYGEAIRQYKESIQVLRNIQVEKLSNTLLILLIRSMLKLGLAFERRNTYSSAYITYTELCKIIIKYRDIDLSTIGLVEKLTNEDDIVLVKDNNNEKFYQEIMPKKINPMNEIEIPHIPRDKFLETISKKYTPTKEEIVSKMSIFEGIRIIYEPFISKLQMIEKTISGGIAITDLYRLNQQIEFLHKTLLVEDRFLLLSEIDKKIGDIIYYKNSSFKTAYLKSDIGFYKNISDHKITNFNCKEEYCKNSLYKNFPCWACFYYHTSLNNLLCKTTIERFSLKHIKYYDLIYPLLKLISDKSNFYNINTFSLKAIAGCISDIGNTYLSCSNNSDLLSSNFLTYVLEFAKNFNNINDLNNHIKNCNISKIECVFLNYYISSLIYQKNNEEKASAQQLIKILYLLIDYVTCSNNSDQKRIVLSCHIDDIKKYIVNMTIKRIDEAYNNCNLYETNKLKEIFKRRQQSDIINYFKTNISLKKTILNTELEEINLIFAKLKIHVTSNEKKNEELTKIIEKNLVSPFNLCDSIYNRILRLQFKSFINYQSLKIAGLVESKSFEKNNSYTRNKLAQLYRIIDIIMMKGNGNELTQLYGNIYSNYESKAKGKNTEKEIFEFLISDSIFSLFEVTKLTEIYADLSLISYSFIASVYAKLYDWIIILNMYLRICSYIDIILNALKEEKNELKRVQNIDLHNKIVNDLMEKIQPIIKKIISEKSNHYSIRDNKDDFSNIDYIINMIPNSEDSDFNEDGIYQSVESKLLEIIKTLSIDPFNINVNSGSEFLKKIEELIGPANMPYISENIQQRKAIKYYYAALSTHNEGKYYYKQLEKMNYLNGDFDDPWFHFTMAIERYRINTDKIRSELRNIKSNTEGSEMYNHDNYLKTQLD